MEILLRREVWVHSPYFKSPLSIEVPVPSLEIERSCICVLGVSILSLSTILIFDLGISATVLYFVSFFHSITCYVYVYIHANIFF
jgi:hypothetical protein